MVKSRGHEESVPSTHVSGRSKLLVTLTPEHPKH